MLKGVMSSMKPVILGLLFLGALVSGQGGQRFTGAITDDMCAKGDHSRMRMGSTDAECTIACHAAHGALYVLYDGKETYILSDQDMAEKFAGKKVTVDGTLDAKTGRIQVASIRASD